MSAIERIADAPLRFGDWGPGYLSRFPAAAFGVLILRPGDEFSNHLHRSHTESFLIFEGELEIWLDRSGPTIVGRGELVHAEPGVEHFLRNRSDGSATALFVKSPWIDKDKVDVPWSPAPGR